MAPEVTEVTGPKVRVRTPEWHEANRARRQALRHARRAAVIEALGGKCVCCGEDEGIFLAVDHILGGGGVHREEFRSKRHAYWLDVMENLNEFRILCHNCNHAVHFNGGVCPHQTEGPR